MLMYIHSFVWKYLYNKYNIRKSMHAKKLLWSLVFLGGCLVSHCMKTKPLLMFFMFWFSGTGSLEHASFWNPNPSTLSSTVPGPALACGRYSVSSLICHFMSVSVLFFLTSNACSTFFFLVGGRGAGNGRLA